jgi:hypothetical protein
MDRTTTIRLVAARFTNRVALNIGDTFENEKWRIHRYSNSIVITDLANAGKRGKKVDSWVVMSRSGLNNDLPLESMAMEYILWAKRGVDGAKMKAVIDEEQEAFGDTMTVYIRQERGVDVMPGGFEPFQLKTNKIFVEVTPRDFTVKNLSDVNNDPTCIPASKGGLKSIPTFYAWVKDNEAKLKGMDYGQVLSVMDNLGVKYHDFCAMD